MKYPKLMQVIANISADNGGCSADEWEEALADFTDEELWTLAAGEETEQAELLRRVVDKTGNEIHGRSLGKFLNLAFDA